MKKIFYYYLLILSAVIICTNFMISCNKRDEFLNAKPNQSLAAITSLDQLQKLLSNESVFNQNAPSLGEASTDDYYVTSNSWVSDLIPSEENTYIWAKNIFAANDEDVSWVNAYNEIYCANTALDALPNIQYPSSDQQKFNTIKGTALFFRAISFYNLVQNYALPFDSASASTTPGIPLRLSSDLNIKSVRASEKECYDQIIGDLKTAITLLPAIPTRVTLPGKAAANALLARIFLAVGDYSDAFTYTQAALDINNQLMDFNNLISNASSGFLADASQYPLVEDIFHSTLNSSPAGNINAALVDSILYQSYDNNDLRKSYFFLDYGGLRFVGSYEFVQFYYLYDGLATDELYLIRAECNARKNDVANAMNDLNALLQKRYLSGTFAPRTAVNADDALRQILQERRKELCFRGLRWTDLRRLNKDSRFAITMKRIINGTIYTLPPNDPRYALPIFPQELQLSGIEQNPR